MLKTKDLISIATTLTKCLRREEYNAVVIPSDIPFDRRYHMPQTSKELVQHIKVLVHDLNVIIMRDEEEQARESKERAEQEQRLHSIFTSLLDSKEVAEDVKDHIRRNFQITRILREEEAPTMSHPWSTPKLVKISFRNDHTAWDYVESLLYRYHHIMPLE